MYENDKYDNNYKNKYQANKKLKCEIYRDSMQNYKRYGIPHAQLIIADIPYCYDELTECWTRNGWKKYTELTYEDEVLSLNSETFEMKYSGIANIIVRDAEPTMVKFESKDIDLMVTENHRMFACKKREHTGRGERNRKFTSADNIRLAKDVSSTWYIPRSGYTWKEPCDAEDVGYIIIPVCEAYKNNIPSTKYMIDEVRIPLEDWLPFFGLWLADGCTCTGYRGENRSNVYCVSIKQAGDNRKIVKAICDKLPYKCIEYKEKDSNKSNFNIYSKQLWLYLRQFGTSTEKFIPRWILDLPQDKLALFWKWYTFGDSHKNGKGIAISSVSKQLIMDLQEVALKLGVICQVRTAKYEYNSHPLYYFQFNKNSKNITYASKQIVSSDCGNHVWCITLKENSVFLVRRKWKIAFCGNCVNTNFYASNPQWYNGGNNKNGESKKAGKAAFNSDFNFNVYEYFHFCSRMMKKDDNKKYQEDVVVTHLV